MHPRPQAFETPCDADVASVERGFLAAALAGAPGRDEDTRMWARRKRYPLVGLARAAQRYTRPPLDTELVAVIYEFHSFGLGAQRRLSPGEETIHAVISSTFVRFGR